MKSRDHNRLSNWMFLATNFWDCSSRIRDFAVRLESKLARELAGLQMQSQTGTTTLWTASNQQETPCEAGAVGLRG